MRKPIFVTLLIVAAGLITLLFVQQQKEAEHNSPQLSLPEVKYVIGSVNETIDRLEADKVPAIERWQVINDLTNTVAIEVICNPSSSRIADQNTVKQIIDSFQAAAYVATTEYPTRQPDVKVYFRKADGFIMAGRLFAKEGVIESPEGPIIKIDPMAVQKLMQGCSK